MSCSYQDVDLAPLEIFVTVLGNKSVLYCMILEVFSDFITQLSEQDVIIQIVTRSSVYLLLYLSVTKQLSGRNVHICNT